MLNNQKYKPTKEIWIPANQQKRPVQKNRKQAPSFAVLNWG